MVASGPLPELPLLHVVQDDDVAVVVDAVVAVFVTFSLLGGITGRR